MHSVRETISPTDPHPKFVRLWTIREAADYLAISQRTVERARNRGDFPQAVRIGKSVRFEASAVVAWAFRGQESA